MTLDDLMNQISTRRSFLVGMGKGILGLTAIVSGISGSSEDLEAKTKHKKSSKCHKHKDHGPKISRKKLESLYAMNPRKLVKSLNTLIDRYKINAPKFKNEIDLASIVRIMYFEEEYHMFNPQDRETRNDPDAKYSDKYFYDSFRGIAQVIINRINFTRGHALVPMGFADHDVIKDKFGYNFVQIYRRGNNYKKVTANDLKGGEWNCLDAHTSRFTGTRKDFQTFSGVNDGYVLFKEDLIRIAVRALVDNILGVSQSDKNNLSYNNIRIGRHYDITKGALFYKNDDIATPPWWEGNSVFGSYKWYFTKVKLGGHLYFSVGLPVDQKERLSRSQMQRLKVIPIENRGYYTAKPLSDDERLDELLVPKGADRK